MDKIYRSAEDWLVYFQSAAKRNGYIYYLAKSTQIAAAAAVPVVLNIMSEPGWGSGIAGGLGALVVIIEGFLQLFQFHKVYLNFQNAAESVRIELFLHANRTSDYEAGTQEAADVLLAKRVGLIALAEHGRWGDIHRNAEAGGKGVRDT